MLQSIDIFLGLEVTVWYISITAQDRKVWWPGWGFYYLVGHLEVTEVILCRNVLMVDQLIKSIFGSFYHVYAMSFCLLKCLRQNWQFCLYLLSNWFVMSI